MDPAALIDFILHAEAHLRSFIADYGTWVYALLFGIIFAETGLVVMPFLPGDSLLFAVGALAAEQLMDIKILYALLLAAAILGDFVNYSIGRHAADWVLKKFSGRIIKPIHMQKAHAYFEKYGAWAIILARFAPFLRTFVPFVAGGAKMSYSRFALFNAIGGFLWITSFLFAGYFFGQLPFVKDNFKLLIMGIIIVSLLPAAIGFLKARKDTENGTL